MSPGVWGAALLAALQASWRVMISVGLLAGIPTAGIAAAVVPLDDGATSARLIAIAAVLPLSFFVHEFGHAFVYSLLAVRTRLPSEVFGIGGWTGGRIVRWPLRGAGDSAVAAAGPLGGALVGLPLSWAGGAYVLVFPFTLLFCVHLVSLRASADDGAQLRLLWTRGSSPCS